MTKAERLQGLYAITDSKLTPDNTLEEQVAAALAGGTRIIQYRDKSQDQSRRERQAKALLDLCLQYHATFIVNDDVALAKRCNAHGVHLGLSDTAIRDARDLLGPTPIIGGTCHGDINNAHRAHADGADYVAFGRFFPSGTKPNAPLADLAQLSPHIQSLKLPAVAIGGITLANAPQLRAAGFAMLAVVADVFAQSNIQAHCQRYQSLFQD